MASDGTVPKQLKPWAPGQSGNPAGRPKGSRNKLSEAFTSDLLAFWEEIGPEALRRAYEESALGLVKTVASVIPKELTIKDEPLSQMSDDDLERLIGLIRAAESGSVTPREHPGTPGVTH